MNQVNNKLLTVILPCFNEEQSIPLILPGLIEFCRARDWKVICVNDGSTDNTLEALKRFDGYIKIYSHKVNQGYGAAVKTGTMYADTFYCVTMDADGQHLHEDLEKIYERAIEFDADMIVGSRKGKKNASISRGLGKWLIRSLAKFLMHMQIYDINSGMRIYRRDLALQYFHLVPNTFSFCDIITLVFINQKHLVLEEEIDIRDRVAGISTIGINTAINTVYEIINIVTLFNPMKIFLPISIFFLVFGIFWGLNIFLQGKGVSIGSSMLIIIGIVTFLLGLITEQLSKIRIALKSINY